MHTHLQALRATAVALIQEQATKDLAERVAQFEALARQVAGVSPHQLRHGLAYRLWKTSTPEAIRQILGHSRVATTVRYGRPTRTICRQRSKTRVGFGEGRVPRRTGQLSTRCSPLPIKIVHCANEPERT